MLEALMPVDGAGNSPGMIRHIGKRVQRRELLEIHVLNVPPPRPGDIARFLARHVMDDHWHGEAEIALAPTRTPRDAAGIASAQHAIVGHATTPCRRAAPRIVTRAGENLTREMR